MHLSIKEIANIEAMLAPGIVLELRVAPGGVNIFSRPQGEMDLPLPCLISQDSDVELSVTANKVGDYPVPLGSVRAPAGFMMRGIAGYMPDCPRT